jgi:type I site-specific restriction endonuclease
MENQITKVRFYLKVNEITQTKAMEMFNTTRPLIARASNWTDYQRLKLYTGQVDGVIKAILDKFEGKRISDDQIVFCKAIIHALDIRVADLAKNLDYKEAVMRNVINGASKAGFNRLYDYVLTRKDVKQLLSLLNINAPL